MKKRFIRIICVFCTVLLTTGMLSVWAAAETVPATPTDLIPGEINNTPTGDDAEETGVKPEEGVPAEPDVEPAEKPEEKPQEKPGDSPEEIPETKPEDKPQEPAKEKPGKKDKEEIQEDAVESEEIIITKAVKVGESWNGRMKKTKPAILKLDVGKAQTVHMLIEGKNVWATVNKADRPNDKPIRGKTDSETDRTVISWKAEAGSYLITLGPAEPNLMAKANVSFMNDSAYEAWKAEQEENQPETEEDPGEQPEEEEPAEEPEKEYEEQPAEEQPEGKAEEEQPAEEPEESEPEEDEPA